MYKYIGLIHAQRKHDSTQERQWVCSQNATSPDQQADELEGEGEEKNRYSPQEAVMEARTMLLSNWPRSAE